MPSSTATTPSTASADTGVERSAHRRARRHAAPLRRDAARHHRAPGGLRATSSARRSTSVATVTVSSPVKDRDDIERAMRELEGEELDGLLVVMLTYGPAMNVARALAEHAAPRLRRQHPARPRGHGRLGHGRPDLQPGHPRRPGHGQRARPLGAAVRGRHRRLALAVVRRGRSAAGRARRRP